MSKIKKRKTNTRKRAQATGWLTTDADEVERRRLRGSNESFRIEILGEKDNLFADYRVHSQAGQTYRCEIRSLAEPINSCECPDHHVNGLGTCKHIEATLLWLQQRRKHTFKDAALKGSPCIEIYLDRRDHRIMIRRPGKMRRRSRAGDLLAPFFRDHNTLAGDPLDKLPALQRVIDASDAATKRKIRVSGELTPWLATLDRREQQHRNRQHFETEMATGKVSLDLVKHRLYSYQQEGILHLAFTGRALLADEMGLGKTVQAIAACELLRRMRDIRRVLVIAPASLKGEWKEQIAKFTDLPSLIVQGPRTGRLRQYREDAFFYLANYEQIRPDVEVINTILAPELIILDEAQRIKNWRTRTATAVKLLKSPLAFVLTGTPVENRIDEIYSIAQFLDPHIFGPLFRFNRDFYQLDEKGRAVGYKNLDLLHERLRPLMLRRRKEEVEGQLPGRTVNTYFVPMHVEQTWRYEEYQMKVSRLASMAKKRPLTKEEMDRLQQALACMRMLCDTPYILDQDCRISPKLKELGNILQEILADGEHKIIIFSEWERMLQLVREQADAMGLGYALHTGKVPQAKRRSEIHRFKNDPDCQLFLSTDSGSVGLNLQVADVVINLDMPWNPARLEQRIARAWRKHQRRPVQVINLVAEDTIEHRMLSLLEQKRSLAERVVDGRGKKEMALPSGRAAFLERLDSLLADKTTVPRSTPEDPLARLCDEMLSQWGPHLDRMELYDEGGQQTLLVVAEKPDDVLLNDLSGRLQTVFPGQTAQLKLLDRETFSAIQQLIEAGILSARQAPARVLYHATDSPEKKAQSKRLSRARDRLGQSDHKRRMAKVLHDGGFAQEALAPMSEAVETALHALTEWRGHNGETPPALDLVESMLVQTKLLPVDTLALLTRIRENSFAGIDAEAENLLLQCDTLLSRATSILESAQAN